MSFDLFEDISSWVFLLIISVPLVTILLGETIDRLRLRNSNFLSFARGLRAIVLPTTILYILAKYVLNLSAPVTGADGELRNTISYSLVLTIFYIGLSYGVLRFLGDMRKEPDPKAWENRIPGLFKAVLSAIAIVIPIIFILEASGVKLGSFAKYAGFTVAAIGFALQDALSSITKGILLVIDKPFAVGDWIEIDGIKGEVTDISWRSTRLRVSGNDIVVIPNLIISDNSVYNFTAEDISYRDDVVLGFSYDDPPNRVKDIMQKVMQDCPDIAKVPAPRVYTISYDDFSIGYRLFFWVDEYRSAMEQERIRDDLMTRVWYAASRGGLSIPFPINVEGPPSVFAPDANAIEQDAFETISANPHFAVLPEKKRRLLAQTVDIRKFSAQETVFNIGDLADAVCLIKSGEVDSHANGSVPDICGPQDIISELALIGFRSHTKSCVALKDTVIFAFAPSDLSSLIAAHPPFARKMNRLIDIRLKRQADETNADKL